MFPQSPFIASTWTEPRSAARQAISSSARCSIILGPAFAGGAALFAHVAPLGRRVAGAIASAAVIFAIWRRPWRYFSELAARGSQRIVVGARPCAGGELNSCFYEAIFARLPLGTVGGLRSNF